MKRGHSFTLDATFNEVDETCYDALVIAGGRLRKPPVMDKDKPVATNSESCRGL